ncbi:MAG: hypothetical protein K6E83_06470 [Clostridium sp.]|nr:hypothetical protein [Clostridium sp.]
MNEMKKRFEVTIDHPMLKAAKANFDASLKIALGRAIRTGSMEGSATVKISFEIRRTTDTETGEEGLIPLFKYKAGYAVPMKENFDGEVCETSRILKGPDDGEILLVNDQVCMEELLKGAGE